ncbi:DICT sensory domain-containing protein [Nocardioides euryhalodurans]|uniref:MerR family transcriptional regulator n=1 Tax=Nocardioides euryhalodurans TaxID=2518370 RepID=A0A4P7GHE4_9ACTN|nr:DICT sensory domain-containing protein [Nocardioides euryhalodurans]QBR91308.1 MerR family transcriptional regulator [Nocardioides euryhalodurans]
MRTAPILTQPPDLAPGTLLTIGELAAHTGLTPELLRTWESRHGFPEPTRLPSGHRRYTDDDVRAVQRVLAERDRGVRLEHAIEAARRAGNAADSGSVYASLCARHPDLATYTLTKRTLLALSWAIEDECLALASRAVLVGTFQKQRYFGQSAARWADLARTARAALVMADFEAHDDAPAPARVALPPDSPLLREWIVACDGPGLTAALVAWELPGQHDVTEAGRQFEAVWTVEGRVVRDTAVLTAEVGAALGSGSSRDLLQILEEAPPPRAASARAATSVFNRMVAYTDGTVLRGRTAR